MSLDPNSSPSSSSSSSKPFVKELPTNKEVWERFKLTDFIPSLEFVYAFSSFSLFVGGAVFGAKRYLKSEEMSTNLRKTLFRSPDVNKVAARALLYGTGLSVGTFGMSILVGCALTGIKTPQEFGHTMRKVFRLSNFPDEYYEKMEIVHKQEEKKAFEYIDEVLDPYLKSGNKSTTK